MQSPLPERASSLWQSTACGARDASCVSGDGWVCSPLSVGIICRLPAARGRYAVRRRPAHRWRNGECHTAPAALAAAESPRPAVAHRRRFTRSRCGDHWYARATAAPLSCPHHATSYRALRSARDGHVLGVPVLPHRVRHWLEIRGLVFPPVM
jgi:hypothetical protein